MSGDKAAAFAPIEAQEDAAPMSKRGNWQSIVPIPDYAPEVPERHHKLGRPSVRYLYRNADGQKIGEVWRFDETCGDKTIRPLTWRQHSVSGALKWCWKSWDRPRPVYGLDRLASAPRHKVVICEGEKAADAAEQLLDGFVAVTSPGGSEGARAADWVALKDRDVVIWPDNDQPGRKYARAVTEMLVGAGAASIKILKSPSDACDGWDAADALEDGWSKQRTHEYLAAAKPADEVVGGWNGCLSSSEQHSEGPASPPSNNESKEGKGRRRGPPQRDLLNALVDDGDVELWHDKEGKTYATYPHNGHRENSRLDGRSFKRWLEYSYYCVHGGGVSSQAYQEAVNALDARAYCDGPCYQTSLRVAHMGGKVYLDLCDDDWRIIKVCADGWQVVDTPPSSLRFLRSQSMAALPEPVAGEGIDRLRGLVNVESDNDFVLLVAWLVAALNGQAPYSILALTAEAGAGKTMLCDIARSLVDPSTAPSRSTSSNDRDLFIHAANAFAMVFDNLSHVPPWQSDAFCRLSSGGGFATRQLHTDSEETVFYAARPIVINGISELASRGDLAQRALTVELGSISESERRPASEIKTSFKSAQPAILGALLDGVSSVLRNLGSTELDQLPRMADFALVATAAEAGLGWQPGTFMKAYSENRDHTMKAAFESDIVARAIANWIRAERPDDGFEGTATELLAALDKTVDETVRRRRSWPANPGVMGAALRRAKPLLEPHGFVIETGRNAGERVIYIQHVKEPSQ